MEPDSLSFLTLNNKVQSHLDGVLGGLRVLRGLCFQDTPARKHKLHSRVYL